MLVALSMLVLGAHASSHDKSEFSPVEFTKLSFPKTNRFQRRSGGRVTWEQKSNSSAPVPCNGLGRVMPRSEYRQITGCKPPSGATFWEFMPNENLKSLAHMRNPVEGFCAKEKVDQCNRRRGRRWILSREALKPVIPAVQVHRADTNPHAMTSPQVMSPGTNQRRFNKCRIQINPKFLGTSSSLESPEGPTCGICYDVMPVDGSNKANLGCCEPGNDLVHKTCWDRLRRAAWLDENGTGAAKVYNGKCPFCQAVPKPRAKKHQTDANGFVVLGGGRRTSIRRNRPGNVRAVTQRLSAMSIQSPRTPRR